MEEKGRPSEGQRRAETPVKITAAEMRSEQNALVHAFNDRVRGENIRYRSFLRKTV